MGDELDRLAKSLESKYLGVMEGEAGTSSTGLV